MTRAQGGHVAQIVLVVTLLLALTGGPRGDQADGSQVADVASSPTRAVMTRVMSEAILGADAASLARPAIAITIDDLPWVGGLGPGDTRPDAMERLLAALRRHEVPATGFVVCERMADGQALLRRWLSAGMELGNHSITHAHLDAITLDQWSEEVCDCRRQLADFTGRPVRFFRYPFLQMGATAARRDSALAIVQGCGHEVAHVSVDTSEWVLLKPYVSALQDGDQNKAHAIRAAYVQHLLDAIDHYRALSSARAGRDIAQVLLLHANALAADCLDTLLTSIAERGWQFVPLDVALADSVYQRPDDYVGPIGLSWLYRFAPAMDSAWAWDNEQVEMMSDRFAR